MMDVSFLLLSKSGLPDLVQAVKSVAEYPVLAVDGAQYSVREQEFSQELQIALFRAADIPIQPAMCYVLEG